MRGGGTPVTLCLVLALAALFPAQPPTWPAAAQTATGEAVRPAEEAGAVRVHSHETSPTVIPGAALESLLGREVRTRDEDPGRIIDVLSDRDGQVRAAVIELGGFLGIGSRKVAVDWSVLRFDSREKGGNVFVDMDRDQLRSAPEYKPGNPTLVGRADE